MEKKKTEGLIMLQSIYPQDSNSSSKMTLSRKDQSAFKSAPALANEFSIYTPDLLSRFYGAMEYEEAKKQTLPGENEMRRTR